MPYDNLIKQEPAPVTPIRADSHCLQSALVTSTEAAKHLSPARAGRPNRRSKATPNSRRAAASNLGENLCKRYPREMHQQSSRETVEAKAYRCTRSK